MKPAGTKDIKEELASLSQKQVVELCLRVTRFRKENKELLSYLLFDSHNSENYVNEIKEEINEAFAALPNNSRYLIKKALRSVLKNICKYSRFIGKKEAETELRLHFCRAMKQKGLALHAHQATMKIYTTQVNAIQDLIHQLHEDLHFDYQKQLNDLTE